MDRKTFTQDLVSNDYVRREAEETQESSNAGGISEVDLDQATNSSGLAGRINLRIEKKLESEIHDIAEDPRYPLNTASEVVRFCCLQGVQQLRKWKNTRTLIGAIRAANALALRDKLQCESLELIQVMEERVDWYIEQGEFDEVIAFVGEIRGYFESVCEGFWKKRILKEMNDRFAQWSEAVDAAKEVRKHGDDKSALAEFNRRRPPTKVSWTRKDEDK